MTLPVAPKDGNSDRKTCRDFVRAFGLFNLIVGAESAISAKLSLLQPSGFWQQTPQWDARSELWRPSLAFVEAVFVIAINVRFLGLALLISAGVGLLLIRQWGRLLSRIYGVSAIIIYGVLFLGGVQPAQISGDRGPVGAGFLQLLLLCIYPVVLLWGMSRPGVVMSMAPSGDTALKANGVQKPGTPPRPTGQKLWTAVFITALLAVLGGQCVWWVHNPVQREILKLRFGNTAAQTSACAALARMDAEGVEALSFALSRPTGIGGGVRRQIIRALGSIGPEADGAIPVIRDAMSRFPDLQWESMMALSKIGSVSALATVIHQKPPDGVNTFGITEQAIFALSQRGEAAVPVLMKVVESPTIDVSLRREAVAALGAIGPDARTAIPVITKFADEDADRIQGTPSSFYGTTTVHDSPNQRWKFAAEALHGIGLQYLKDHVEIESLFFPQFGGRRMLDEMVTPTALTDAELEHIASLRGLRRLGLGRTAVSDGGLSHLASLRNLELLWLSGTEITDDGLKHIKELTSLKWLDLSDTNITDKGLPHLEGLTNLQWLRLSGSQVTSTAVSSLQMALPDCQIDAK